MLTRDSMLTRDKNCGSVPAIACLLSVFLQLPRYLHSANLNKTFSKCHIQGGPQKSQRACFIANILKTPRPNCVEAGELLQYCMLNAEIGSFTAVYWEPAAAIEGACYQTRVYRKCLTMGVFKSKLPLIIIVASPIKVTYWINNSESAIPNMALSTTYHIWPPVPIMIPPNPQILHYKYSSFLPRNTLFPSS